MSEEGFRERLSRLIRESGLSNERVGVMLGVGATAVQKWRDGSVATLTLHNGLELARLLKISPWYLACKKEPNGNGHSPEGDDDSIASRFPELERRVALLSTEVPSQIAELAQQVAALAAQMQALQPSSRPAKRKRGSP